jgi:hypothetical protein
MSVMGEKRILGSMEKTGFGTSVSFDLEKSPEPKRRRKSQVWQKAAPDILHKINALGLGPDEFANRTKELFREFDTDSSGTIDIDEFATAINELELEFSNEQIEEMFYQIVSEHDDEINFEQFEQLLLLLLEYEEEEVTGCPGCGAEISHDEWLDSLVGFVSGAHSFMEGGPVKARIVEHLRHETSRMSIPQPHEEWELEVVERLMGHLHSLVEAEANRMEMSRNQKATPQVDEQLISEIEHAIRPGLEVEIRQQVEVELRQQVEVELRQRVEVELRQRVEVELRQQIESELWQEFEQAWRQKSAGDEES